MAGEQDSPVATDRHRLTKVGVVTSNKMAKTVVVEVQTLRAHSVYKRTMRQSTKFMAHDAKDECAIGDKVQIVETRPLSRRKRWRVQRILEKSSSLD